MKVKQFTNDKGVAVRNQFILMDHNKEGNPCEWFQSYESTIAVKETVRKKCDTHSIVPLMGHCDNCGGTYKRISLDRDYWDYSKTTGKYRNLFLGESKAETEKKIKSGEYQLVDLNNEHRHTYVDDSGLCAECSRRGE